MRLPQEDMCQALGVSPNLKYEADGGPGIEPIMRLLLESKQAEQDRDDFFRAQVLFWLLAAIDGHAKNFSVFLQPQGRFQLTPLYDILSAHPLVAKKQLQKQKLKMAMALRGKNTHTAWHMAQRRHFLSTAKAVQYSQKRAEAILDEMIGQVEVVISQVIRDLPAGFPEAISEPIFSGMRSMAKQLA